MPITRSQKSKFIINKAIYEINWLANFLRCQPLEFYSPSATKMSKLMYIHS